MSARNAEQGFSFIDVMIAIAILLTGCLALGGALAASVLRTQQTEQLLQAKHLATSTIESVLSARDLKSLGWASINSTTFPSTLQNVYSGPGTDGIIGTTDDSVGTTQLPGYTRTIAIQDFQDTDLGNVVNMKEISVTVTYRAGAISTSSSITTRICDYAIQ